MWNKIIQADKSHSDLETLKVKWLISEEHGLSVIRAGEGKWNNKTIYFQTHELYVNMITR